MAVHSPTVSDGARVFPLPPPLYYAAGLAGGALLDRLAPLPLDGPRIVTAAGVALVVAGAVLTGSGVVGVVAHRTTIVPHRPVSTLVTGGGYRWSRNPMYAGLAVAYLGVAALIGSWWPVLLWPLVLVTVARVVIRPEERYLSQRFGQEYGDYCARVRRWL